jgi:hypothetical protein
MLQWLQENECPWYAVVICLAELQEFVLQKIKFTITSSSTPLPMDALPNKRRK